jgi:hypothetical protein
VESDIDSIEGEEEVILKHNRSAASARLATAGGTNGNAELFADLDEMELDRAEVTVEGRYPSSAQVNRCY